MAGPYRHQALIEAPIEDVWEVVSNPRTHPDWWPDVIAVDGPEEIHTGDAYERSSKPLPFVQAVTATWVAERIEHLKEAHYRCELSGTFARFSLTSAQDGTFVQLETGADPTSFRWRFANAVMGPSQKRWILDVLDGLAGVVRRSGHSSRSR